MGGEDDPSKPPGSPREHAKPKGNWLAISCRRTLHDLVRLFDKGLDVMESVFGVVMKVLGPLLICLALSLISFVTHTYFTAALPNFQAGPIQRLSVSSLGVFLLFNALYNYGKCVCSDPGRAPEYKDVLELSMEADKPRPRQCAKCHRHKPQRAHHCSVCRQCILKMDHHCPWINNCVGHGNYRHFCLFMLFIAVSCLFVVVVFLHQFPDVIFFAIRRRKWIGHRQGRSNVMTSFIICCSILVALSILGGFHVYLCLTNQTTIEMQTNMSRKREARKNGEFYRNPYDLGRARNFHAVFGPADFCSLRWLLPYLAPGPSGDGIEFPSLRARGI